MKDKNTFRTFVESVCPGCVYDILGFGQEPDSPIGEIFVGKLSNHQFQWRNSWRGKLWAVKWVLQGRTDGELEFYTRDGVNEFIDALCTMRDKVWPG